METTTLALLVLVPLLVWRIYSRLKRLMSRTRSQLWRHWLVAIAFPVLFVVVAAGTLGNVLALSCLAAGALAGGWIGVYGLKLTRFENTVKGLFFTPNRNLGIAIFMLFIARLIYRGLELYLNSRMPTPVPLPTHEFAQSPLTLLTFGLFAGYYTVYGVGLLRWHRAQTPVPVPPDPYGLDKLEQE